MYLSVVGHTMNKIRTTSDRNQFFQIHVENSGTSSIKLEVPQGLSLAPTLFAPYVNDFPYFITAGELYMFADNTTIFTVGDIIDAIIKTIQVYSRPSLILCSANRLLTH